MQYTLATIATGYLIGALPHSKFVPPKHPTIHLLGDIAKGAAAALLATVVIGTEFSIILTALAALVGHNWPLFPSRNYKPSMAPALGVLFFLSPHALAAMAVLWIAIFIICREPHLSSFLSFLSLPLLLWCFKPFDVYVLFGLTCSGLVIYQYLTYVEKNRKSAPRLLAQAMQQKATIQKALLLLLVILVSISLFFTRYVYRGFGMQIDLIRSGPSSLYQTGFCRGRNHQG